MMRNLMSWTKFKKAYLESSRLFHENVTPNLPEDIQKELRECQTFSYSWEGKEKVMLSVNGKRFDITQWYVPGQTIFDVYEYDTK